MGPESVGWYGGKPERELNKLKRVFPTPEHVRALLELRYHELDGPGAKFIEYFRNLGVLDAQNMFANSTESKAAQQIPQDYLTAIKSETDLRVLGALLASRTSRILQEIMSTTEEKAGDTLISLGQLVNANIARINGIDDRHTNPTYELVSCDELRALREALIVLHSAVVRAEQSVAEAGTPKAAVVTYSKP